MPEGNVATLCSVAILRDQLCQMLCFAAPAAKVQHQMDRMTTPSAGKRVISQHAPPPNLQRVERTDIAGLSGPGARDMTSTREARGHYGFELTAERGVSGLFFKKKVHKTVTLTPRRNEGDMTNNYLHI